MNVREKVFLTFLVVNVILSLGYLLLGMLREKVQKKRVILLFFVCLFFPGAGLLFILFSYLSYRFIFIRDVDLSDVIFSKDRKMERIRANEERDRNVVPLEEAIEVADTEELRNLVMNVAQGDYEESLATISLALNCEDTETAHYAASVLQDALNNFRLNVTQKYNEIRQKPEQITQLAPELLNYMNKVLQQHVFGDVEQKSFVDNMEEVAELLYEQAPEELTGDITEAVTLRLLESEEFETCEKWCMRGKQLFPDSLFSYTCALKYYFNSGQRDRFFEELSALKSSAVIIDRETLELIRTFQ